jgi:hypothetical protein
VSAPRSSRARLTPTTPRARGRGRWLPLAIEPAARAKLLAARPALERSLDF